MERGTLLLDRAHMKKKSNERPKKIAVFRALQIGDLLCSIPAIRTLKKAIPNSEITLIGLPWAESFVKRFSHYFSGFIEFPGYPGLPEQNFQLEKFTQFLHRLNHEKFDLLIQLHGNGSVINPLMCTFGAARITGFYEPGRFCPDKELFMPYPEELPEIERHLSLLRFLGLSSNDSSLEFPFTAEEEEGFTKLTKRHKLTPREYICIHPGARDKKRMWAPEKFASVADILAQKGYTIVLTGTEAEKEVVRKVADIMQYPSVNLTGKTDLGTLALLIKNAKLLLSNDTGVSHLASAVKTPSVVIFLASDPKRWAPVNHDLHLIILPEQARTTELALEYLEKLLGTEVTVKIDF